MNELDDRHYIPSPCVRQCTLNDEDVCVGCGRTLEEVKAWSMASFEDQEIILKNSEDRLKKIRNPNGY